MIITYLKADGFVISIVQGFPTVWEDNNRLLIEGGFHPLLNDLTKAGWGIHKDKHIIREMDEEDNEIPLYIQDLVLEPIDASDLPQSKHIGKLIAVNQGQVKLAMVRRRFCGEDYDFNCLVTQSVAELFQLGKIEIGDFVLFSFVTEIPGTTERRIAIVEDKVFKSW